MKDLISVLIMFSGMYLFISCFVQMIVFNDKAVKWWKKVCENNFKDEQVENGWKIIGYTVIWSISTPLALLYLAYKLFAIILKMIFKGAVKLFEFEKARQTLDEEKQFESVIETNSKNKS